MLALEIGVRLNQQRFLLLLRCLRDLQGNLVVLGVDLEQQIALPDGGAVLIGDLVEEALHARDEIDAIERRRRARQLHVERDLALIGLGDRDLGRRRRLVLVLLLAGAEQQNGREGHANAQSR